MARKKWSDAARKRQSKAIKEMWAEKKKAKIKQASVTKKVAAKDTREPWEVYRDEREAARLSRLSLMKTLLTEEQLSSALHAARVLYEFHMDYNDGFEIFDGTLPRRMIQAKEELTEAFNMAEGYNMPSYESKNEG